MAWRVDPDEVREILETDDDIEVQPFIKVANRLVDRLSTNDSASLMAAGDLKDVELYLSAHFYALKDPQYQNHSTAGASATYQGQTGMYLDLTWWGQMAKVLDATGYLQSLEKSKARPAMHWLGTVPSTATDYVDRD